MLARQSTAKLIHNKKPLNSAKEACVGIIIYSSRSFDTPIVVAAITYNPTISVDD